MEHRMRLAERRGLLGGGRRLSRVQLLALDLLMLSDARERGRQRVDSFRFALVSHDPAQWCRTLFPEWFDRTEGEEVEEVFVDPGEHQKTVDAQSVERLLSDALTGTVSLSGEWL